MSRPLYSRALGEAWHALPQPLRRMHDVAPAVTAQGLAQVDRGTGVIARILASVAGLPPAGADVPLSVRFTAVSDGEAWERSFAGRRFSSRQSIPCGVRDGAGAIVERVGPIALTFALTWTGDRLDIATKSWTVLGLPLPISHQPISSAYEYVDADGRFAFVVEASHPWIGLIVRYRGWLIPELRR